MMQPEMSPTPKKAPKLKLTALADLAQIKAMIAVKAMATADPTLAAPYGKVVTITPEMAAAMLEKNLQHNRPIQPALVRKYADAMIAGHFLLNGETIKISHDGTLVDGQHRLSAIILAGVPIETFVVYNVIKEAYITVDMGWKKTSANILHQAGINHSPTVSGAIRWIASLDKRLVYSSDVSPWQTLDFALTHPEVEKAASAVSTRSGLRKMISPSAMTACLYAFRGVDETNANNFLDSMVTGANLAKGNAVHTLRERLVKARLSSTSINRGKGQGEYVAWVINAWNAYRLGKTLIILKGPVDEDGSPRLPEIVGWKGIK